MSIQDERAESVNLRQLTDPPEPPAKVCVSKLDKYLDYQSSRLEKTQGHLMIVATVIASMAFQAAVNPPSELWKNDSQEKVCPAGMIRDTITNKGVIEIAITCRSEEFIICNTIAFSASLSIILLLTVLPLKNRFSMWIMLITVSITVIFTAATYMLSIMLVEGKEPKQERFNRGILFYYLVFWFGLLAIIILLFALRLLFWLLKKLVTIVFHVIRLLCLKGKRQRNLEVINPPAARV
ncbi:hypothetical protein JCGZ_00252 [Jatropha curcas]|uniref:PGG domain-containing protein n=1 Tax=Jatropha curcas TaxID=180498 RepID=A0A067LD78_JATCU|nr:hypothetical protein JCGZ_00252 [Jatropha curcas]